MEVTVATQVEDIAHNEEKPPSLWGVKFEIVVIEDTGANHTRIHSGYLKFYLSKPEKLKWKYFLFI